MQIFMIILLIISLICLIGVIYFILDTKKDLKEHIDWSKRLNEAGKEINKRLKEKNIL